MKEVNPDDGKENQNIKKRWWTQEEDEKLKQLVDEYGARNWKRIAGFFEERTDVQCLHRWQKVLNPKLIKGPWVIILCYLRPKKKTNWSFDWWVNMALKIGALSLRISQVGLVNSADRDGTII